MGQNYLGPNFDPGPEDGYYYTYLGPYGGELNVTVSGFGYNRVNGNDAGGFDVSFYFSPGDVFVGADGLDVAGSTTLLGSSFVNIAGLTGGTARSQAFSLTVPLASRGVGDQDGIWLRISDGPDDGNLFAFDEPIIDNLSLSFTVVPEPSTIALWVIGGLAGLGSVVRSRRPKA